MKYLDTNVFARILVEAETPDQRRMQRQAQALFAAVEAGEAEITTSEAVLHELFYVLTSPQIYDLDHQDAATRFMFIWSLRGFRMSNRRTVEHAIDLFRDHEFLDFADCLCIAHSQDEDHELVSFDRGISRVPGVLRFEP